MKHARISWQKRIDEACVYLCVQKVWMRHARISGQKVCIHLRRRAQADADRQRRAFGRVVGTVQVNLQKEKTSKIKKENVKKKKSQMDTAKNYHQGIIAVFENKQPRLRTRVNQRLDRQRRENFAIGFHCTLVDTKAENKNNSRPCLLVWTAGNCSGVFVFMDRQ